MVPRMSVLASARWRLPPNTTSASAISPRATGAMPSTPSSPMPTMDSQRRGAAVWAATGLAGDMRHILILGGTSEARQLAGRLADRRDLKVTLSLAGRTAPPAAPPGPVRVRGVDRVEPRLDVPRAAYIVARGPFSEDDESALLKQHRIEVVVAKNSGGKATKGKIAAARALGIKVVMLRRPTLPDVPAADTVQDAVAWLDHVPAPPADRGV